MLIFLELGSKFSALSALSGIRPACLPLYPRRLAIREMAPANAIRSNIEWIESFRTDWPCPDTTGERKVGSETLRASPENWTLF
jgi:hypothetical protein